MAPLSKLTLTSYRRTQPNRDPVEERRSKTLTAPEQQKLVLAAAQKGQEHRVTKPGWARDTNGNRQRVEKTHAVRPWFFKMRKAGLSNSNMAHALSHSMQITTLSLFKA